MGKENGEKKVAENSAIDYNDWRRVYARRDFHSSVVSHEARKDTVENYMHYIVNMADEIGKSDWGKLRSFPEFNALLGRIEAVGKRFDNIVNNPENKGKGRTTFSGLFIDVVEIFEAYNDFTKGIGDLREAEELKAEDREVLDEFEENFADDRKLGRIVFLKQCMIDGINDPALPGLGTVEDIRLREEAEEREYLEKRSEEEREAHEEQIVNALINERVNEELNVNEPNREFEENFVSTDTKNFYVFLLGDLRNEMVSLLNERDERSVAKMNSAKAVLQALDEAKENVDNLGGTTSLATYSGIGDAIRKAVSNNGLSNYSDEPDDIVRFYREKLFKTIDAAENNIPKPEAYVKNVSGLRGYSPEIVRKYIPKELKKRYELMVVNNNVASKQVPQKALTNEQMYDMLMDPRYEDARARLSYFRKLATDSDAELKLIEQELDIRIPENSTSRVVSYAMDMSGTVEAHEKNIALVKKISTPDGRAEFINDTFRKMLNLNISDTTAYSREHVIEVLENKPGEILTAFAVADMTKNIPDGVDTKLLEEVQNCELLITNAADFIQPGLAMSSVYYGTLNENLTFEEIMKFENTLSDMAVDRLAAGYDLSIDVHKKDEDISSFRTMRMLDTIHDAGPEMLKEKVLKGELTGRLYEYEMKNEKGETVTVDAGLKLANGGKKVEIVKKSLKERTRIENEVFVSNRETAPNLIFGSERVQDARDEVKNRVNLDLAASDLSEEDEDAYERMEKLSEENRKKLDLIIWNDKIVTKQFPEMKLTLSQMVDMAEGNNERERLHQRALAIINQRKQGEDTMNALLEEYGVKDKELDPGIKRVIRYAVNTDNTEEARKENIALAKQLKTKAGQTAFAEKILRNMLNMEPDELYYTDEYDCLDKLEKGGQKTAMAFAALDLLTNGRLPIDENLANEYRRIHAINQNGGNFRLCLEAMASPYYTTLNPKMGLVELAVSAGGFMAGLKDRIAAGFDIPVSMQGGDAAYDALVQNESGKGILDKESVLVLDAIKNHKIGNRFSTLDAYDETGKKIDDIYEGYKAFVSGKNVTFKERSDEELKELEQIMNGKSVNSAENSLDFNKVYDEITAQEKKTAEDEARFEAKKSDIVEAFNTLRTSTGRIGLDMDNPADLARIIAVVPKGDGRFVSEDVFCSAKDRRAVNNLDSIIAAQKKISLPGSGEIKSELTKSEILHIYDMLSEGKLFIRTPGSSEDMVKQLYLQDDGYVAIADWEPKELGTMPDPTYYNLSKKDEIAGYASQVSSFFTASEENAVMSEGPDTVVARRSAVRATWEKYHKQFAPNIVKERWEDNSKFTTEIMPKAISMTYAMEMGMTKNGFMNEVAKLSRNIDLSVPELVNRLNNAGASIDYKRPENTEARKQLSDMAFAKAMQIAADRADSISSMNRADPEIRDIISERSLTSLLLHGGAGMREENEKTAHEWKHGDAAKRAEIFDNCIRERLTKIKELDLDKPMNDAELVGKFDRIFENIFFFTEIERNYKDVESDKYRLPVDQKLKKEVLEMTGNYMHKYMYMQARFGMITSPYYAEIDPDTILSNPAAAIEVNSDISTVDGSEINKLMGMAYIYTYGKNDEYFNEVKQACGDNLSKAEIAKILMFDANGNEVAAENLLNHFAANDMLFVKGPNDEELKLFTVNRETKEMVSVQAAPEHENAIRDIKYKIETEEYMAKRRIYITRGPLAPEYIGRGLKEKYSELYDTLDSVDGFFQNSSTEFRNIKAELKRVSEADGLPNEEESYSSLQKINGLAIQYVANKKAQGEMSANTAERYNKIDALFKETNQLLREHRMAEARYRHTEASKNGTHLVNNTIKPKAIVNDLVVAAKYTGIGKPIKSSLTEEDKIRRRELQNRLADKVKNERKFDENGMAAAATDFRFVNEFILDNPKNADARNEIIEAFRNPAEHRDVVVKHMTELYSKIEAIDTEFLYGEGITDEKLVDHYEEYSESARMLLQLQNMEAYCKKNDLKELDTIANRAGMLSRFSNESGSIDAKIQIIQSPIYTELDVKDIKGTMIDEQVRGDKGVVDIVEAALGYSVEGLEAFENYGDTVSSLRSSETATIAEYVSSKFGVNASDSTNFRVFDPEHPEVRYTTGDSEVTRLLYEGKELVYVDITRPELDRFAIIPAGGYAEIKEKGIEAMSAVHDESELYAAPGSSDFPDKELKNLKNAYRRLYGVMAGADSIFVRSSKEFAGIKEELKNVAFAKGDIYPEAQRESLKKVVQYARTYIQNKEGKTLSTSEGNRLNAVKEVLEVAEPHLKAHNVFKVVDRIRGERVKEQYAEERANEERLEREQREAKERLEKEQRETKERLEKEQREAEELKAREDAERKAKEEAEREKQLAEELEAKAKNHEALEKDKRSAGRGALTEDERAKAFGFTEGEPEKIFKKVLENDVNMLMLQEDEALLTFAMMMSKPANSFKGDFAEPARNKMDMLNRLLNGKAKLSESEQDKVKAEAANLKRMGTEERKAMMTDALKDAVEKLNNFVSSTDKLDHKVAIAGVMIDGILAYATKSGLDLKNIVAPENLAKTKGSVNLGKLAIDGYKAEITLKEEENNRVPEKYVGAAEDFMYMKTMEGLMKINASVNRSNFTRGEYPASAPQLLQGNGETLLKETQFDAGSYKGKATKIQEFLKEMVASSDFCKNLGKMDNVQANKAIAEDEEVLNKAIENNARNVILETGALLTDNKKQLGPSAAQRQNDLRRNEVRKPEINQGGPQRYH